MAEDRGSETHVFSLVSPLAARTILRDATSDKGHHRVFRRDSPFPPSYEREEILPGLGGVPPRGLEAERAIPIPKSRRVARRPRPSSHARAIALTYFK